jgi:DNA modification methylase
MEVLMHTIQLVTTDALKPNERNVRTHSKKQIRHIANSIRAFGFTVPVLIDENAILIAGHGRLEAAKHLGLNKVPAIVLEGLSEAKKRALLLADNKIADNAGWDRKRLAFELPELTELLIDEDLDISITGFEPVEIDQLTSDFEEDSSDPADALESSWLSAAVVSEPGDLWQLGDHRLLCGDARNKDDLDCLMGRERAAMGFLDPPYNVRIKNIVGRGRAKHGEFAMASGEMSRRDFIAFLTQTLSNAANLSGEGSVHFVCMDWRHIGELIEVGQTIYGHMLNLVVWVKTNAGQGSFYRSQHELVGVFRVGEAQHLNNIELGRHGRSRSNVWHYAGVNTFRKGRMDELSAHPTVKPAAMVADALKDCTKRGDIVLDTFCGAGTTILAAERVGRRAYAVELEPRYVDAAIRRWQAFAGEMRSTLRPANRLTNASRSVTPRPPQRRRSTKPRGGWDDTEISTP